MLIFKLVNKLKLNYRLSSPIRLSNLERKCSEASGGKELNMRRVFSRLAGWRCVYPRRKGLGVRRLGEILKLDRQTSKDPIN